MSTTIEDHARTTASPAAGSSPKPCPVCCREDGLWVDKDGRQQVWHPTRLFPCAVYPA